MESFRVYKPVLSINEIITSLELAKPGVYTVELNVGNESWLEESRILNELLKMRAPYLLTLVNNAGFEPDELPGKLIDLIGVFVMGVSYERRNEQPVIGIRGMNTSPWVIKNLSGYFRSQGFQDICFLNFVESKVPDICLKENSLLAITGIESINFFSGDIPAIDRILNQYVYFRGDTLKNTLELENEMNRKIVHFLNENKDYDLLIKRLMQAENQFEKAENKYILQTRKLAIAESFVEVAKNKYKDDYESLFEYYHKEYEVLPVWFKRLGHIIKVLTGHRKFKSLITDEHKEKNKRGNNQ
jgi:hypothetical protein